MSSNETDASGNADGRHSIGIDGARGGWVVADIIGGELSLSLIPSISSLNVPPEAFALIDMPIGIPKAGERACDQEGAAVLGSRRASIFPVPARAAVEAGSYKVACEANLGLQGKKFSIQMWNIIPKVRELDVFLQNHPDLHVQLAEGHPEIAFLILSGRSEALPSKKEPRGQTERLKMLKRFLGDTVEKIIADFAQRNRPNASVEDAIDAAGLACFVMHSAGAPDFLGDGAVDCLGMPMRIAGHRGIPSHVQ
jgi:predicted RNase H-like nuclease